MTWLGLVYYDVDVEKRIAGPTVHCLAGGGP